MATPRIEVEIGASNSRFEKAIDQSITSLGELEKRAKELRASLETATDINSIARYNQELADTKSEIQRIKTLGLQSSLSGVGSAASKASSGVNQYSQAVSGANGVGIEFSRIIQDAPFGIIGVGNNITQLASSFSNLQTQTGSASKAVKIAFQSIISPANLLVLGISAVTTAFTLYQMGAFGSKEATKDLREELDKFKETLDQARQAQLDGISKADRELISINSLRTVVENETIAREKRLAAAQKLQELSPEILGNLSKEKILAGEVGDSYEKITRTLLARATAESSIQRVVSLQEEERLIREKIPEALQELAKAEERVNKNRLEGQTELAIINENAVRFIKQQNPELVRLEEIEKERLRLIEQINTSLIDSGIELGNQVNTVTELESVINRINQNPLQLVAPSQEQLLERLRARYQELQSGGIVEQPRTLATAASGAPGIFTELASGEITGQAIENLDKVGIRVNELSGAFTSLGGVIGRAFNAEGLGAFLGQFIPFVGRLIANNFKIATSAALAKGAQDSIFGGPFTLPVFLTSAAGLIATAFRGIGSGSSIGASGIGGGSAQNFGGAGLESSLVASGIDVGGTIEIDGTKILIALQNAEKKRNRG